MACCITTGHTLRDEQNPNDELFHRVFLGWLHTEVERGHVPASQQIEDMAPVDLKLYRALFDRFLREREMEAQWQQLEREHGPIETLAYFNG